MADVQISSLGRASSAETGDYLIINKENSTTQRIDFGDLIAGLGTGGGGEEGGGVGGFGFAPQFHNFPSSLNYSGSASSWTSNPTLHSGPDATISIKMPKAADMALISFQYSAVMNSLPNTSVAGPVWCQFGGGLNLTGATSAAGCGTATNSICMGANMSMYNPVMAYEANPYTAFTVGINPIKFSMLTFAEGAEVTFTATGSLKRAKKCMFTKSAGRMIVFPFNSKAIDIATMQSIVERANDNVDFDIAPDPLPGEEKGVQTEIIVEKLRYVTDVCNKTLSDPNFTAQYGTLESIRDSAFLLRNSDLTFDLLDIEAEDLLTAMRSVPGIGVNFSGIGATSTYGIPI